MKKGKMKEGKPVEFGETQEPRKIVLKLKEGWSFGFPEDLLGFEIFWDPQSRVLSWAEGGRLHRVLGGWALYGPGSQIPVIILDHYIDRIIVF